MNPDELPDFPLASWELPPDSTEPLVAPATMRWHGELFGRETDWLVREFSNHWSDSCHVLIRASSYQEEANWWIFDIDFDFIPDHSLRISRLLDSMVPARPWRVIHLRHGDRDWAIHLRSVKQSSVGLLNTIGVSFSIEWPFDFLTALATQVHDEVLRAWNDEESDLNFARRWLLLSPEEQLAFFLRWKVPDIDEFQRAIRLILRALQPLISSRPLHWFFHPESYDWWLYEQKNGCDCDENTSPLLQCWQEALVELFKPAWNEEVSQHPCAQLDGPHMELMSAVADSSFHEQLEAARELSLWLDEREARDELPAATIARLRDTLR